jgi:hypothetical protein
MHPSTPENQPKPHTSPDSFLTSLAISCWAGIKSFFNGGKTEEKASTSKPQSK